MVEIETWSRIPIWRTFVCQSRKWLYLSRQLRYIDEIWFADRLWHSEGSDINNWTNTKPEVVYSCSGRHLEKWIWRHISVVGAAIWTKFGSLMQNNMQITANWSRSKSEVEFQYGGRLYFENGSSYISAAIWDISTKFGLLIDCDLLKAVTSTDTSPEVVFSRRGRHLDKWIWRYISAVGASIWTNFAGLMQNNVQISGKWSKSKPKVNFQYGGRLFFKNESSYISVNNWDMSTKSGLLIDFVLLKTVTSTNTKP